MLSSNFKNPPKILMIAPEPFLENRGTPISVYQRVLALSKLGYRVDLITYPLGMEIQIPGVRIHRIPRIPFIKDISIGPSWTKVFFDFFLILKAILILSHGGYQILHSHEEAAYFSFILAAVFRLRHIYDMHSSLPIQISQSKYGRIRPIVILFRLLERITIRNVDAVITIGPDLDEYIHKIKPDVNSTVIENLPLQSIIAGDVEAMKSQVAKLGINGRVPVVYAGSFEIYQGLELLISSVKIITASCKEVVFILIGGKPDQIDRLKRKVEQEQLEQHFIFTGPVSADDSLIYMNLAEILVSPRISGMSIPLKIYTYLCAGKAIVATNIEAHARVLKSEYAILAEPTVEGIADGLIKVLQDPELRHNLGRQAKLISAEKYSFSDYISKVDHIYQLIYPMSFPSSYPENVILKG